MTPSQMDPWFENAPLMMATAHIAFTQSPEVLQRITEVKAGLAKMDFVVAESTQQTNIVISLAGRIPQVTQNPLWWFRTLGQRRAVGISQNFAVLYDADYGRFDSFLGRVRGMVESVVTIAGPGCFLTAVSLRYISGFASDGAPSPYICPGLQGIPVQAVRTSHFHHEYSFWCDVQDGGRLTLKAKTVHGNQLVPREIVATGLAFDPRFSFSKDVDAVQLDIFETLQKKMMERLGPPEVERILFAMRNNIKSLFLAATTEKAHIQWRPASK